MRTWYFISVQRPSLEFPEVTTQALNSDKAFMEQRAERLRLLLPHNIYTIHSVEIPDFTDREKNK